MVLFDLTTDIGEFGKYLEDAVWPTVRSRKHRACIAQVSSDLQVHGIRNDPCISSLMRYLKGCVDAEVWVSCVINVRGIQVTDEAVVEAFAAPASSSCCAQNALYHSMHAPNGKANVGRILRERSWRLTICRIHRDDALYPEDCGCHSTNISVC